jgi:hypothetical protein
MASYRSGFPGIEETEGLDRIRHIHYIPVLYRKHPNPYGF